ncbi:Ubiquinone/menaquinone biosynthesis C-methyltransferase UbiE [Grimontia celer]|uniref:Ubiquinone/menaquinone biosynthesis C-methyltransferase UbiE n=1 Tax=Grimontia celer TaxID=1796497 RepID=A0A128FEM8_9GAMM|nr:class I SAM-dependent methyltransferase [Grimontia celer]CZF84756.1 Ubiquinone/menaquinone biosynthesis C-methyltransferase UbiE [Grimontia celer]
MDPQKKINDFNIWSKEHSEKYDENNYNSGVGGYCMRAGHAVLEKGVSRKLYEKVLEVGSGSGVHIEYVNHEYHEYYVTDASNSMLDICRSNIDKDNVVFQLENAIELSFEDDFFDRVIACHVLEHLSNPIDALLEWYRKCKSGGVISILLPCDPGLMWRFGRTLGPRKKYESMGLPYDFIMANEHINPITNLIAIIRFLFDDVQESWWPTKVPNTDLNLFYCVHINVEK